MARVRRNRVVLALAVAVSVAILAAWFPTSSLLHQRAQLAAASVQLGQLQRQNAVLRHEEQQLRTPTTLGRIAQQQYDLVPPGDEAYQVLPASGSGGLDGTLGPASAPAAAHGSPNATTTASHARGSSGSGAPATSGGLLGRMLQTLEFWR
ncbi:MAG: FtsB family cell division protein [Acidimicrobiales bacterium]